MHTQAHGHPQPPRVDELPSPCSYTSRRIPQHRAAFWECTDTEPFPSSQATRLRAQAAQPVPCPITDTGDALLPKQSQRLRARTCLGLARSLEEAGSELRRGSPCQIRSLLLLVSREPPCFSRQSTGPPATLELHTLLLHKSQPCLS